MAQAYILDELITQICCAVAARAVFVFWNHQVQEFCYYTMQDNDIFHQELRNLRKQRISGIITCVMAGEPLVVSGSRFHVMEVTFASAQCAPYMLLRRDGNSDHMDITPYLFKSANSQNAAITYINRGWSTSPVLGLFGNFNNHSYTDVGKQTPFNLIKTI